MKNKGWHRSIQGQVFHYLEGVSPICGARPLFGICSGGKISGAAKEPGVPKYHCKRCLARLKSRKKTND